MPGPVKKRKKAPKTEAQKLAEYKLRQKREKDRESKKKAKKKTVPYPNIMKKPKRKTA